jgi:hypothetical protein
LDRKDDGNSFEQRFRSVIILQAPQECGKHQHDASLDAKTDRKEETRQQRLVPAHIVNRIQQVQHHYFVIEHQ